AAAPGSRQRSIPETTTEQILACRSLGTSLVTELNLSRAIVFWNHYSTGPREASKANDKVIAAIGRSAPVLGRSNTRTAERLRFVESRFKGRAFLRPGDGRTPTLSIAFASKHRVHGFCVRSCGRLAKIPSIEHRQLFALAAS